MEADAESMIGSRVGIKTCARARPPAPPVLLPSRKHPLGRSSLGDTLEGVVFTYDTAASALVLEQRAKSTDSQARRSPSLLSCLAPFRFRPSGPVTISHTQHPPMRPSCAGHLQDPEDQRCARDHRHLTPGAEAER